MPSFARCRSVDAKLSIDFREGELVQATDGDAATTSTASPSLPTEPELVRLFGPLRLLYLSAQKKGQAEGMREAAEALLQLLTSLAKQGISQAEFDVLKPVLHAASVQLAEQAARLDAVQNSLLGQYIAARRAGELGGTQTDILVPANPEKLPRKWWVRLFGG